MLASIKTLFSSIVDYAGLFPPAKLTMEEAIANYVRYQNTCHHWMLGNFVLPVSRINEFEQLLLKLPIEASKTTHWRLSVIISQEVESAIAKIQALNDNPKIAIASLEFPPLSLREIDQIFLYLPADIEAFFEIPYNEDLKAYLTVLQRLGISAKIRAGGLSAEAFPTISQLYRFIFACAEAQVAFKATAGLHHPLPGNYPLTYEPDSSNAMMYGFLNVAVLAALVYWQKVTVQEALVILQESTIENFQVSADSIVWKDCRLNIWELQKARQSFFRCFGSCSFQEPIELLQNLKLL
ncbi:hypothetical protein H6G76_00085 [Nostoc sp. FACHB-152]|uniref:hypothetical protein n=1 Tax=unclassified Nostoc TaxID=2593658 RepID=UPI00168A04DA|nr:MULTISPECIES: hypothetical protein [unclassified Nostoc]MBD2445570.1 hypothetical protein [Nostoc sp. FACHB-152]MBD2466682.1 hypothetical protein [Nostoc sp. FACHB-145]